jgi:outer membrane protein assembly factor BamB
MPFAAQWWVAPECANLLVIRIARVLVLLGLLWIGAFVLSSNASAATGDVLATYEVPPQFNRSRFPTAPLLIGDRLFEFDPSFNGGYVHDAATGAFIERFSVSGLGSTDGFGEAAVRIGDEIFVSARNTTGGGHVYSFDHETLDRRITIPPATLARRNFGLAMATMGDRLVIGSVSSINPTPAVHVIDPADGSVELTILQPTTDRTLQFATTIAVAGTDIYVGGARFEGGPDEPDKVYAFDGNTGELKFTIPNPTPSAELSDLYGDTIAVIGDRLFVNAIGDDDLGTDVGAVHMFDRHTGQLLRTFTSPTRQPGTLFGYSLAVVRDDLLVGAPEVQDLAGRPQGAAYLFDGATGEIKHTYRVPVSGTARFDAEVGLVVGAVGNDALVSFRGEIDGTFRAYGVRLQGYDERLQTIATTSFEEPAFLASTYRPGVDDHELGFVTTGAGQGLVPRAAVSPSTQFPNTQSFLLRQWNGAVTFDEIDLRNWGDVEVTAWFLLDRTTYQLGDSFRIFVTNGIDEVDLFNVAETVENEDAVDNYGRNYFGFTEVYANVPDTWQTARLVVETNVTGSGVRRYLELDEVRFRGVFVVPEPSAISLLVTGLLAVFATRRRRRIC